MSTSGTYNFSSPESVELINDAYERIGVIPPVTDRNKILSAQRSINLILQHWPNQGKNLWTIREAMIALNTNQNTYAIPSNAIDLKTVAVRNSSRNLGGEASSSDGGDADNAFDSDSTTGCIQNAPDGNIAYLWTTETTEGDVTYDVSVSLVGIQSNATLTYTLVCEYLDDDAEWVEVLSIPVQSYPVGETQWFIVPIPVEGISFRVRETGGSTLNIRELYFNNNIQDLVITRMSESEYNSLLNKKETGPVTGFYINRQITPTLQLWKTPGPESVASDLAPTPVTEIVRVTTACICLFFSYWKSLQDIGGMSDVAEIPARFLEPLCAALAYKLALKGVGTVPTEHAMILAADAKEAFMQATENDRERVATRIYPETGYSDE